MKHITWVEYWSFVLAAVVVYAIIIGLKFYYREIKEKVATHKRADRKVTANNKQHSAINKQPELFADVPDENPPGDNGTQNGDILFQQAEELIPQIKEAVTTASEQAYVIEEFLQSLKIIVRQYPLLNTAAYRVAITNLIVSECEKFGNLHAGADELAMIWLS